MQPGYGPDKIPGDSRGSEKRHANLEQAFDILYAFLVGQKQYDVVVGLYHDIVMRDNDLFTTHDGADGRAGGELDLIDGAADHFGAVPVTVCDGFYRLCRAAAQ
jgi:hypothetical protein